MNSQVLHGNLAQQLRAFYALTKPRVVSLIVFTAVIGMFLAVPGMVPAKTLIAGTLGIALVAGAAAAVNCLVEQKIDALMRRTRWRPLPRGELTAAQALLFAGALGGVGLWILFHFVNALTMWLTFATFTGYAVVYTVLLKQATPQNIVIGGASGAMPPVLGWAAATGEVSIEAMLLFLIIFAWTPPHFWALALYRIEDYAKAGVPMLPVTHGKPYTRL
ncbi:MAG: heme o synthase, partial [Burkholderiales bacterium]